MFHHCRIIIAQSYDYICKKNSAPKLKYFQGAESTDIVLVSTDIVGKFGVTPNTAKSGLRKLTEKGYLNEISLNGRTKGYIRSVDFEEMVGKVR